MPGSGFRFVVSLVPGRGSLLGAAPQLTRRHVRALAGSKVRPGKASRIIFLPLDVRGWLERESVDLVHSL